ncbi:MAG TPA: hypothetical protein VIJ18_11605 [Microbacteriaceae bacterium]
MLHLDSTTLLFANALLTVLYCIYFVLNTAFGINDKAGRIWAISFLSGVIVAGAYIVWGLDATAWWAIAIGNGMFTLAAGTFWAGTRAFNGRRLLSIYPVMAVVVVAGVAVLERGAPNGWGGSVELFASIAVFGALCSVEMLRGVGRANVNGQIFSAVMALTALIYLSRLIALLILGPSDPRFVSWFGTVPAASVFIALTFCASVALMVLRVEAAPRVLVQSADAPLLTPSSFEVLARGWVERAAKKRQGLALAEVRLHGLREIAVAFGRFAREEAIDDFVVIVTATMPTAALPARLAEDRLLILFPATDTFAARGEIRRIADAAENSQVDATGVRMTLGISLAHTADTGYDLDALQGAVGARRVSGITTGITDAADPN